MGQLFSRVRGRFKGLSKTNRFLLISEIGLGICALLFVLVLIRIFLY
ncbi:MAG TPA: hypothetical protein PK325_14340 [Cyclobacteriaceae bacterium]|nr:hypothetical protein [Cyclobacteriaceae bacterium]